MDKETLFRLISNGEVVLWAGAGLSHYAGYPLGNEIVLELYKKLSNSKAADAAAMYRTNPDDFRAHLPPLPEFAELFVNLHDGSRYELLNEVISLYRTPPTSSYTHQQLSHVPFKHIITTNYDRLFEETYRSLHVVTSGQNIPFIHDGVPTLYKIHGEPQNPGSIIITQRDYNNFFNKNDKLLWNSLQVLMSEKTILFLGYSVRDPNVLSTFLKIKNLLGNTMRPYCIVGPGMMPLEQDAFRRDNIHYFSDSAEEFVAELLDYLNPHPLMPVTPDNTRYWVYKETAIYASDDAKNRLRQVGATHAFAIDDSIRLVELSLSKPSDTDKEYLEVECRIPTETTILVHDDKPSNEALTESIDDFDSDVKNYLLADPSFKADEDKKAEWKLGVQSIRPYVDTLGETQESIVVRPLSYRATDSFNRQIIKGKAAVLTGQKHPNPNLESLYETSVKSILTSSELYKFSFPSQLFVELAIATSDNKVMLVKKTGAVGAGVVANIGKAWTCGPEAGLTFKNLQNDKYVIMYDAIAACLKSEFGVSKESVVSWYIGGLCLQLTHLNTSLYGYCRISLSGEELIECFRAQKSKQFILEDDSAQYPELVDIDKIPELLVEEPRYDGKSWHPSAKIRLYTLFKHITQKRPV
jgi:hypothetical protein